MLTRTRHPRRAAPAGNVVYFGRKYALALGGQGLVSAFHLGLHVSLIRTLDPADYGVYALAFAVAGLGTSLSNAFAATPLSVYTPGIEKAAPKAVLETVFTSVNLLLVLALFLVALASAALLLESVGMAVLFAAFVAAWPLRHYSRSFAFARRRPEVALRSDAVYVALGITLLAAGWLGPARLDLLAITLAALCLAHLGSAVSAFAALGIGLRPRFRRRTLRRYGAIWRNTRWILVGVVTTALQGEAHSLVVVALAGPAAYAPLAAGQVLFGPVRVALQAWHMLMHPELAVAIARKQKRTVVMALTTSMAVLGLGTAAVGAVIAVAWDPIHGLLYSREYAEHPMAWIVALCALVTLFYALQAVPSGVLQAFKDFRMLALATVIGSMVSLIAVACILLIWSPAASLAGVLLAAVFTFVFLLTRVWIRIRQPW